MVYLKVSRMRSTAFVLVLSVLIVLSAPALLAQVQIASLLTPPNGATNVNPMAPVQFTWTAVSDEQCYYLYVGTTQGSDNVVNSRSTQATSFSAYVTSPNTQFWVRLWTEVNGSWYYHDTIFTTGAGMARLITPVNGASNIDPSLPVQFTWTSVPGEQTYYLYVGTAQGAKNIVNSGQTQQTSWSASLSPLTVYYVRLWTEIGGVWYYNDTTFTTNTGIARLTTPPNGATNLDPTLPVHFTWTSVPTEQCYYLYVGSAPGLHDVVNSGETQQTSWTANLNANTTYYVTLWTEINGSWYNSPSSFSTGTGIARLQSPQNGATGVSQFQLFNWNTVVNATYYILLVSPTGFNTWDLYTADLAPTVSSRYVWGLEPNTYYYVTLCTQTSAGQTCSDSTFTTGPANGLPNQQQFYSQVQSLTSQVRLMTEGMSNQATPGTPLYQDSLDNMRNPNDITCGIYAITLLDQMTPNQILARRRDLSLDGMETHVITEYWDPFNEKWEVADPTFGLVYFDPQRDLGQGAEDINSLLLAGSYGDIDPLWVTENGSAYMTNYYMDPMTLYTNIYPVGAIKQTQLERNYVPNSPLPFLNISSLSAQGTSGIYVFEFANQTDQITINNAGTIITVAPGNLEGWAAGVYLSRSWFITSQVPQGMNIYTFKRVMF